MRKYLLAAAFIAASATHAGAQQLLTAAPPSFASEPAFAPNVDEELIATQTTEAGHRHSCGLYNFAWDIYTGKNPTGNFGPRPQELAAWCAAQPEAIRRKYGSRY